LANHQPSLGHEQAALDEPGRVEKLVIVGDARVVQRLDRDRRRHQRLL